MKRIEHLKDRLLRMLFYCDPSTKCATVFLSVKDDSNSAGLRHFDQRRVDLFHHCDVEDVQWRPTKSDPGYAIVDGELDELVHGFFWFLFLGVWVFGFVGLGSLVLGLRSNTKPEDQSPKTKDLVPAITFLTRLYKPPFARLFALLVERCDKCRQFYYPT